VTGPSDGYAGHCERCNKKLYNSRAAARRAAKRFHRGEHLSPYPCDFNKGLWHIGHLTRSIIAGATRRRAA